MSAFLSEILRHCRRRPAVLFDSRLPETLDTVRDLRAFVSLVRELCHRQGEVSRYVRFAVVPRHGVKADEPRRPSDAAESSRCFEEVPIRSCRFVTAAANAFVAAS
jgi:hypothetical protein